MSPAAQRYEVGQILAECEAKGWPMQLACFAVLKWFDDAGLVAPQSILEWLTEVPQDHWRPDRVH